MQCIHSGKESILHRLDANSYGVPVLVKQATSSLTRFQQDNRLANEYALTRDSDHPGIRKALEYGTQDGKPALYLEYIDGRSVGEGLVSARQSLADMLTFAVELAATLADLHQDNIIHKKLSSANILVRSSDWKPVIIDFSIAARVNSRNQHLGIPEQLEGDLAYIAPEQSGRINRVVDRRSDLYSLGIIFYEIFTGKRPFTGKTAAELLHDHIAKNPIPVHILDGNVPRPVSNIIMKLLRKNPEERYQSAFGLLEDLRFCQHHFNDQQEIPTFRLGQNDFSGRLHIPDELLGREQELTVLRQCLAQVSAGGCQRLLVSGQSGMGKTRLITELARTVVQQGGLFLSGQFDQYRSNHPYSALNQLFAPVLHRILGMPVEQMTILTERLRTTLGNRGRILSRALPTLEPLLGNQELPPTLTDATGAHQELYKGVHSLLLDLASSETPLLILVDDLQWADEVSLEVLYPLFLNGNIPFCLFIGAYNDEHLRIAQPFARIQDSWSRDGTDRKIEVKGLGVHGLNSLISKATASDPVTTQALTELVQAKTGGNPLLVRGFLQSLNENGLLNFNFSKKQWQWDINQLREKAAIDDVAISVTKKIESLPALLREIITAAACIGSSFDQESLSSVVRQSHESMVQTLWQIAGKQLIQPSEKMLASGLKFSFTHNRIRQAAYSLLSTREKRKIHLQLGRFLIKKYGGQELTSEQVFVTVDHFNQGFKYIKTDEERLRLAELNLLAGSNANRATAYQAAVWYLNMGIGLLPADRWKNCYPLTSRLFTETIEAEYRSHNFSRVFLFGQELIENARKPQDKIAAYKFQLLVHTAQDDNTQVMEAAFAALEALGVVSAAELANHPPTRPSQTSHIVDTATIIKASHMLSEEIHLDQLLDKLMQVVIENAGAEKGLLIVPENEGLVIQAIGVIGENRVTTMQGVPVEQESLVPLSVVNFVARTGETVVLADAFHQGNFNQDAYIRRHRTRSVLCLPIVHKSRMAGLLYLENNLATNVFTADCLKLLQSLLSQAAISMENAKLYASLQEKIEELNQTQKALESSRNWLDKIINTINEPIFVKDRQHHWVLLNDSFCQFMGFARHIMIGKSDYDFYPREEADIFWAKDELVFSSGKENSNEESFTDARGKVHTIITKKALYIDENDDQFIVGIIRDISERINLEAQLRQAAKMEAVGTLAGGVAHDFNNLLTAILGYCDLLLMRADDNEKVRHEIGKIKKAGESAAGLTRQLLAFSRKQVLQLTALDLNQKVRETQQMLQRLIGEDIVLESSLDPNLHRAVADPILIEQVIMNLSVNARDAMPTGGRLTIETANAELDEMYALQYHEVIPGDYVMMAISDTGIGLNEETKNHIFEPFFTTKEKGKGTGLGLATVYGIVKQTQGHIAVYSETGHGTTFKIYLPRAEKDMKAARSETQSREQIKGGIETILLTEDNKIVRDLARAILEEKGYRVLSASCGKDALQIMQDLVEPPDLVITDVVMPGMSGSELVRKVSALFPGIKILYISGYTGDAIVRHGVLEPDTEFLQKPFTPADLAEKVRNILDTP